VTGKPLPGLTIKAALILGFSITLGVWLITGIQFARRLADAQRQSSDVAAKYVEAQELLASVRAETLNAGVQVRDALLDTEDASRAVHQGALEDTFTAVDRALSNYVPMLDAVTELEGLDTLRRELADFRAAMRQLIAAERHATTAQVSTVLNREVVPRRNRILAATEALQATNRSAFIRRETDVASEHGLAERQTWQRLGWTLLTGLGIAVIATIYASRLERRLVSQLAIDAENTRALQSLSTKLITAQEEERRHIARELHDEVGQVLSALKMELVVAQRTIDASGGPATLLESAQAIASEGLHSVRDMSHLLHPSQLDDLGLAAALDWYTRDFSKRFGVKTEFRQDNLAKRLPAYTEIAAYRIVQEALTNVVKHAEARSCVVTLRREADVLEVSVEDDGAGFDAASLNASGGRRGLGLIGIRERALQLNGSVTVTSAVGHGTRVKCTLPVADTRVTVDA
jgi:signal transduction histidine kinase